MIDMPKVSIIIPVYNGSNYLSYAIECALSQTYKNLEVIVVNDGSNDGGKTEDIAKSYGDRIRYFSKSNGGVSSALNYGIRNMTGEYFSWLSHDDLYSKDKVSDSVKLLRNKNLIGTRTIAFTSGDFIDARGNRIKGFKKYFKKDRLYSGREAIHTILKQGTLYGCCMLIPKCAFEDVGLFDESLRYSQDSLMWYRIFLSEYSIISDDNCNVCCRLHKRQTSQTGRHLYEHDSLCIAKELSGRFLDYDDTGKLLFNFTKRQMKYQCKETIRYLIQYAGQNNQMDLGRRLILCIYNLFGKFRNRLATFYKKTIIKIHGE